MSTHNNKDLEEAVRNVFMAYDADGSGKLELVEVTTLINDALYHLHQNRRIKPEEIVEFMQEGDSDHDGLISQE